jgi:two-component system sensor histidine kinase DegS
LSLTQNQTNCYVDLRDNGVGFDKSSVAGGGGFGLKGMRERIEKVGGHLAIETTPGKGTHISIDVPLRLRTSTK